VLTLQDELQDARAERDRAEGVLVSLIRQLLPGARPVYLHSAGIRELDRWTLNEMLARHGLRVWSKATHLERLVKVHIDGEHWAGHTHFWLEPLPAAGVAEADGDSDQAKGRDAV